MNAKRMGLAGWMALALAGCGDTSAPPPAGAPTASTPSPPVAKQPAELRSIDEEEPAVAAAPTAPAGADQPSAAQPAPQPAAPAGTRVKADVGVGKKGRGYGEGIITTPVAQYFIGREAITFQIQLPKALKEFQAIHDRLPKTQEEFNKEILQKYGVELPELPDGERYVYDPKAGELMVEQPK